jgi:hypothetical protein
MKSIFSYFIIIFINFIACISLHASARNSRAIALPAFSPTEQMQLTSCSEGIISLIPITSEPTSPTLTMELARRTTEQARQLHEHITRRQSFNQGQELSIATTKQPPIIDLTQAQEGGITYGRQQSIATLPEPKSDDIVHFRLTRQELRRIEYTALAACGVAFVALNFKTNHSQQTRFIPLGEAVSGASWVLGGVRSCASTGIGLGLVAYVYHKMSGWVVTIYESETKKLVNQSETRTNAKIDALTGQFNTFAHNVDQRFTETGHTELQLSKLSDEFAQSMQRMAHLIAQMAEKNKEANPADQQLQAIARNAQTNSNSVNAAAQSVHEVVQGINQQAEEIVRHPIVLVTPKVKSSCCSQC